MKTSNVHVISFYSPLGHLGVEKNKTKVFSLYAVPHLVQSVHHHDELSKKKVESEKQPLINT